MNWEALGAIGEVAGAIGVVVTLVYLAFQIRQNSAVTRAQTRAQISLYGNQIIQNNLSNVDLIRIAAKRRRGEELTVEEQIQREFQIRQLFRNAEHSFYQHRAGTYDYGEFSGEEETYRRTITTPDYKRWWTLHREELSPAFRTEIEKLAGWETQAG